jgi:hypothetical protein
MAKRKLAKGSPKKKAAKKKAVPSKPPKKKVVARKPPAVKAAARATKPRKLSRKSSRRQPMAAPQVPPLDVELLFPQPPPVAAPIHVPEDAIRYRAYLKWEAAGRPPGDGLEFWMAAKEELLEELWSEA